MRRLLVIPNGAYHLVDTESFGPDGKYLKIETTQTMVEKRTKIGVPEDRFILGKIVEKMFDFAGYIDDEPKPEKVKPEPEVIVAAAMPDKQRRGRQKREEVME